MLRLLTSAKLAHFLFVLYGLVLTYLTSWQDEDVERRACDPVFTSLIPRETGRTARKKKKIW